MINLDKREKIEHPYPILVVENILEESFLTEIIGQFPKYENFIKFKKTMGNRRFLSNDNPDFYEFIKKNNFWDEFYKEINSQEFYNKILNFLVDEKSENLIHFSKLKFNETYYRKNKLNYNLSFYTKELTQKIPRNKIFNLLSNTGFFEIKTNSLVSSEMLEKYKILDNKINILNAASVDLNALRPNLLFGGLEVIKYNLNRQNSSLRFFEFGTELNKYYHL